MNNNEMKWMINQLYVLCLLYVPLRKLNRVPPLITDPPHACSTITFVTDSLIN